VEDEASSAFEILEQLSRRLPTEADLLQLHHLSHTIAVDMAEVTKLFFKKEKFDQKK